MSFTRKRLATLFTTFIRFAEIGTFFKDFLCLHLNSLHHYTSSTILKRSLKSWKIPPFQAGPSADKKPKRQYFNYQKHDSYNETFYLCYSIPSNSENRRAVLVAQLEERSLPTSEIRSSNSVFGEIFVEHCLLSAVLKRQK